MESEATFIKIGREESQMFDRGITTTGDPSSTRPNREEIKDNREYDVILS
jgi:hypothetical protein